MPYCQCLPEYFINKNQTHFHTYIPAPPLYSYIPLKPACVFYGYIVFLGALWTIVLYEMLFLSLL